MIYSLPDLKEGTFKKRLNRFGAEIESEGKLYYLHLQNSGRMKELLIAGKKVLWKEKEGGKTQGTLFAVWHNEQWVILISNMANFLFEACIKQEQLDDFKEYTFFKREVKNKNSRFDFLLKDKEQKEHWVEVKSVNLVVDERALFPDAPTLRGVKHLNELKELALKGISASVVFFVLRADAKVFSPYTKMHADFATALKEALKAGVNCFSYLSFWDKRGCFKVQKIPYSLD